MAHNANFETLRRHQRLACGPWRMRLILLTTTSTCSLISCSQTRKTIHPPFLSNRVVRRSFERFSFSFSAQNTELVATRLRPHRVQPCQKQPSAKMATLQRSKTKSGVPVKPLGRTLQPRIPARTNASRRRTSVVRFPLPLIALIVRERSAGTPWNRPPGTNCLRNLSMARG